MHVVIWKRKFERKSANKRTLTVSYKTYRKPFSNKARAEGFKQLKLDQNGVVEANLITI